jgi:large subunit ribosomal protein L13e
MITAKPKVFKNAGKQRYGRGFSREELKKAGTSLKEALRFGIPIDSRRKTAHKENVESVKTFLESKKAESKSRGKSKS